jgi:hypothetical protein
MPRKSKSYGEYMELAAKKGLTFLGEVTPRSVFTETTWRCNYCGKVMNKAYRSVKEAPQGCFCQAKKTKGIEKYHQLAKSLGIEFVAEKGNYPRNTKVKTLWRGPSGEIVEASYHDIGYGYISEAMKERLGINEVRNVHPPAQAAGGDSTAEETSNDDLASRVARLAQILTR